MRRTDKRSIYGDYRVSNDTWRTGLNNNDLIVGPSGAGKTRGYVIPYIEGVDNESMLVTDCKGMLFSKYKDVLEKKGYKVYCLDLTAENHMNYGYNPLAAIRYNKDTKTYSQKDIIALTEVICAEHLEHNNDPFWPHSTQMVLETLIAFVLDALPAKYHNFEAVRRISNVLVAKTVNMALDPKVAQRWTVMKYFFSHYKKYFEGKDGDEELKYLNPEAYAKVKDINLKGSVTIDYLMQELRLTKPDSTAVKLYGSFSSTFKADKTIASIGIMIADRLSKLCTVSNEMMETADEMLDFNQLGREKTAVFLKVSDLDNSNDLMAKIIYSQALSTLVDQADQNEDNRLEIPVRLVFDDFAAGTIIPNFDNIISVIRSREIYTSIIVQSISQLNDKYGNDKAATIINNCDHLLYLGGQDMSTVEYIAKKANAPFEDIVQLPVRQAYIFERGSRPSVVDLEPFM